MEPSIDDHLAFEDAMEVFVSYETYGFPGHERWGDQLSTYMHVLECVQAARNSAERLERQQEAYESWEKQQQAEEERMQNEAMGD